MTRGAMRSGDVIGVIAKTPAVGAVKTRMVPPLTASQAAALAADLLADTVSLARSTGAAVWCVHAGAAGPLRGLLGAGAGLHPQRGEGLAERLAAAQHDLFAAGHGRVLLLGADCPTVRPGDLALAFAVLDGVEVALQPATDGGYTLLAARRPTPELFAGVPMGTAQVLAATLARAATADRSVALLPARPDIDDVEGLLAALHGGDLDGAPRTRRAAAAVAAALARRTVPA